MNRPKKRGDYVKGNTPIADDLRNRLIKFIAKHKTPIAQIAKSIAVNRTSISGFLHKHHTPSYEIGSRINNYIKGTDKRK